MAPAPQISFFVVPSSFVKGSAFLVFLSLFTCPSFAQTEEATPSSALLKKLSLEELMDLDVTSVSKQPQPFGQAPAAIQVITGDAIRRSGASSLPEALRLADNLQVAQKSSHGWSISARGFNTDFANKLLVLMDGRCVYTPLFSGVFWDVQDTLLADIDRIEVISGPGGTLWGANAVNGVINITSKRAKDTQGAYVEAGGGSELLDFGGVRYGGKLGPDVYYRIYGKYFDRDKQAYSDGTNAADSWRMGQGGFRLDAEPSPEETFTLQGDYYDGDENLSVGGNSRRQGDNILGRWSRVSSADSGLSLQMYYDRTYLYLPKPANAFAPAGILTDSLDTYDLDFQHHFRLWDDNRVIWGLGYRFTHDVVQNAPSVGFEPPTLDHHLFSAFVQDEIALEKNFFLTFGSKVEHNDYTGYEFEPSGRLKWDLAEGQMFWAAVSRAVRAPSRVDRDERVPTPALEPTYENLLIGGPDFKSESVIAYELGYRAKISKEISTSISAFYNTYDQIRSVSPAAPPNLLMFTNNLQGQTGGVELTLDCQALEGWRLHGGYNLLKENIWIRSGETDFSNALNETADPENQIFLRSAMDFSGGFELDLALRWIDSFIFNDNQNPGTIPSYAEVDARLGWHANPNLEFSVVAQNLLSDHHLEYPVSGPDPRTEVQRGIYGRMTCQF